LILSGKNGNIIIAAESGELASGLVGEGRMAEPENIIHFVKQYFEDKLTTIWQKSISKCWSLLTKLLIQLDLLEIVRRVKWVWLLLTSLQN
jgi:phosphopantothenoylcysteine synthetase/decarboxylase